MSQVDCLCVFGSNVRFERQHSVWWFIIHNFISLFFMSLLFRDASTSLVISRLGSLDVYQNVYFYCCVVNVSFVKFTYLILCWRIMVKCIVVMKIQPSICLHDWGKPRRNSSQVGWYQDLNAGPPECESRALPRSHLAWYYYYYYYYYISTNKNGRTEWHLPKTDGNVVRPAGERCQDIDETKWKLIFRFIYVLATLLSVLGKCRSVPFPFLFVSCLSRFSLLYYNIIFQSHFSQKQQFWVDTLMYWSCDIYPDHLK